MHKLVHAATLVALLAAFSATPTVEAAEKAGCDPGGCEVTCPCCNHVCKLSKEIEAESKHCWNVECKPICIPKVRFPWEKCCTPKCAKLKYVRTLSKHEYECEKCKYKWTPVCADCGSCDGCDGCDAGVGGLPAVEGDPSVPPPPPAPAIDASAFRYFRAR